MILVSAWSSFSTGGKAVRGQHVLLSITAATRTLASEPVRTVRIRGPANRARTLLRFRTEKFNAETGVKGEEGEEGVAQQPHPLARRDAQSSEPFPAAQDYADGISRGSTRALLCQHVGCCQPKLHRQFRRYLLFPSSFSEKGVYLAALHEMRRGMRLSFVVAS